MSRQAKIFECRGQILITLKNYEMDVGIEAMITLLAGACAAVELPKQQPLLQQITKEIRNQYKGVARVQRNQDSQARRERQLAETESGQPDLPSVSTRGGEQSTDGDNQGVQPLPT